SVHQSPFFFRSASLCRHIRHSCSGMPCSAHHHSPWSCPFFPAAGVVLPPVGSALGVPLVQPPTANRNAATIEKDKATRHPLLFTGHPFPVRVASRHTRTPSATGCAKGLAG